MFFRSGGLTSLVFAFIYYISLLLMLLCLSVVCNISCNLFLLVVTTQNAKGSGTVWVIFRRMCPVGLKTAILPTSNSKAVLLRVSRAHRASEVMRRVTEMGWKAWVTSLRWRPITGHKTEAVAHPTCECWMLLKARWDHRELQVRRSSPVRDFWQLSLSNANIYMTRKDSCLCLARCGEFVLTGTR